MTGSLVPKLDMLQGLSHVGVSKTAPLITRTGVVTKLIGRFGNRKKSR